VASSRPRASAETAPLFAHGIRALNVGVSEFALSPRAHGATVLELDWRPPAGGDRDLGLLLARLEDDPDDPIGSQVTTANARALERILAARAPFYARADALVETAGRTVEASFRRLLKALPENLAVSRTRPD